MSKITQILKEGVLYDLGYIGIEDDILAAHDYAIRAERAYLAADSAALASKNILGLGDIELFDSSKTYIAGEFVLKLEDGETVLYRALENTGPGWDSTKWVETSLYRELTEEVTVEHVRIYFKYTTNLAVIAGKNVLVTVGSEQFSLITDALGCINFSVQHGTLYSVYPPDIEGYATPKSIIRMANRSSRKITFSYNVYDVGMFVVMKDGTRIPISDFVYSQEMILDYVALEVRTSIEINEIHGNADLVRLYSFAIGFENSSNQVTTQLMLYPNRSFPSLPFIPQNTNANNPIGTSNDYYGYIYTDLIEDDLKIGGSLNTEENPTAYTSNALNFVRGKTISVAGNLHTAYIPAIGELLFCKTNLSLINSALTLLHKPTYKFSPDYWWSSSQSGESTAWSLFNGSLNGSVKSDSRLVLPFFDLSISDDIEN